MKESIRQIMVAILWVELFWLFVSLSLFVHFSLDLYLGDR